MGIIAPPFFPTFGTGAPGANAPVTQWYFDTATTPYTLYTYHSGGWHTSGAQPAINATQIQGVPVSAAAPANGNKLTDVAGTWTPQ